MEVLLADGDATTRALLCAGLAAHDVTVTEAATVAEVLRALDGPDHDLVVLDLALPGGSAPDVVAQVVAARPASHLIVLGAVGGDEGLVRSLARGADEHVPRPFRIDELVARVLAVRRRRTARAATWLRFGRVQLDLEGRRLLVDGMVVEIAAVEFALLAFLAARAGQVYTRTELLAAVWHAEADWQSHATVTEHVRRVRNKIEPDPHHPVLLRTVRGVGYCFDRPAGP